MDDYIEQLRGYFNPILRRRIEIIDTLLALIIIALSLVCLLSYQFFKYAVTQQILAYGIMGLFIASAFLEFIPQLLNPYLVTLVGIASGINVHLSVLMVILGSLFGSILGFALGKVYGPRLIAPLFDEQTMQKILNFWAKRGNLFVLISALTPVPYVPLIFGSLKMSWKSFILFGIIPRILSFVAVGYGYYFGLFQYNL